jgi:ABC-type sugar transport system substrate-binding protein
VGLIAGSLSLRDHIERQFGFEQVMLHEYPNLTLLPVRESRDDPKKVQAVAAQLLADHGPDRALQCGCGHARHRRCAEAGRTGAPCRLHRA